jgi:hypothetical protein
VFTAGLCVSQRVRAMMECPPPTSMRDKAMPPMLSVDHCPDDSAAANVLSDVFPGVVIETVVGLERMVVIDASC